MPGKDNSPTEHFWQHGYRDNSATDFDTDTFLDLNELEIIKVSLNHPVTYFLIIQSHIFQISNHHLPNLALV